MIYTFPSQYKPRFLPRFSRQSYDKSGRANVFATLLLVATVAILLVAGPTIASAQQRRWLEADIGSPSVHGSHTVQSGSITIAGGGLGDRTPTGDQLHFVYFDQIPGGDIDIVARLSSFTGATDGRAGIMLRAANDPQGTMAAIDFVNKGAADGNHQLFVNARDSSLSDGRCVGVATRMPLPLWIRLVRIGNDFGVYKSHDGHIWSCLGNTSGWQFAASGPVEAGFFVASGDTTGTATATFDNISIGQPAMGYKTSWFGNTFGCNVSDKHVSNSTAALWTAPDGTCYTNTTWDEAGYAINSYRDGKVVADFRKNNWMFGNMSLGEGSVTGDGDNIYVLSYGHPGRLLYKSDLKGTLANTVPMYLSIDPFDDTKHFCIISGLAVSKGELYMSDARDQVIRVAKTSIPVYFHTQGSTVNRTAHAIDTTGVANAAPAAIYQTQRECDLLPYTVPNLDPKETYTVRCHFAEYTETAENRRVMTISVSGTRPVNGFDVVAKAGGQYKAAVLDIPGGRADANGDLHVTFVKSNIGDGHEVVCAFEVLKADGTRVFATSCGGPGGDGFQGETYDVPSRSFAFDRPGPMVADSRGDLWIIREANDHRIGTTISTKYPGSILCYSTDGHFTGRQITDVANPTALAYDSVNDRLLIADNGPNQNVRIYTQIATNPVLAGTIGQAGGIFSGATPGAIYDAKAGGYARFDGLTGVGVDKNSNIYVSSGLLGTDLRKFTSAGELVWGLYGLVFCTTPGLDPASDGADAYGVYYHAGLDFSKTAPGSEWSYRAYNWNPVKYGPSPRQGTAQSIVRRLGSNKKLFMFTSGQGSVDYCGIFRYDGEQAIPCGQIRANANEIWIDSNGDGIETPDEVVDGPKAGGLSRFSVDNNGDIWFALLARKPMLRHFRFLGLNSSGAPMYDFKPGNFEDIAFPGTGTPVSPWGQIVDAYYDSDRDSMYLMGPAVTRVDGRHNVISYLARYDDWSTGNRTARWMFTLPDPTTDYNVQYEDADPAGLAYQWMGLDVAADKLFIASLWGNVNVYNTTDGSLDRVVTSGPEVEGSFAWEDASQGLTAFKRKNGEFEVFVENSGWGGKINFYRIPGTSTNIPPRVAVGNASDASNTVPPGTVTLRASAVDDDGSIAKVEFFDGKKLLGAATARPYTLQWTGVAPGTYTVTARATDNAGAATMSKPVNLRVGTPIAANGQ